MTDDQPWQAIIFSVSIRKKEKWRWARPILEAAIAPSVRCLDVGSGVGTLSMLQENIGGRWEFTETDIKAAEETAKVVAGPVTTVDIFDHSLSLGSYDLITVFDVIEHVPDPQAFIRRVRDLLVPGGLAIFTTPADDGGFYFWRRLADRMFGIDKNAHGHVVEGFAKKQLVDFARNANMKLTKVDMFSFAFTEMVELLYNGAYIIKNRSKQKTAGYNLSLSPASGQDVTRHKLELNIIRLLYPLLRLISLLDRIVPLKRGYEWGFVLQRPK